MQIQTIDKTLKYIENLELEGFTDQPATIFDQPRKTKFASVPRSTGQYFYETVKKLAAQRILEIGGSVGYSTLWLARGASETSGHVWTTEINSARIKLAQEHYKMAEAENLITLFPRDASEFLESWQEKHFDLIFIDAFKKDYQKYYQLCLPHLSDTGLMIFDNIISHQEIVQEFLNNVFIDQNIHSEIKNLDNGLLLIQKKSKQIGTLNNGNPLV
jgi:predicted O-methyltransferase YrrM